MPVEAQNLPFLLSQIVSISQVGPEAGSNEDAYLLPLFHSEPLNDCKNIFGLAYCKLFAVCRIAQMRINSNQP